MPYALITDACQGDAKKPGGYGAILAQIQPDGNFRVLSYASRTLTESEKNHAPFLLEMNASVWAMEHFRNQLKGRHFTLYTDHKPLVKLGSVFTKDLKTIQKAMLEFDFEILHLAGAEMPADFLSRNVVSAIHDNTEKWQIAQENEKWIRECKRSLLTGVQPTDQYAIQFLARTPPENLFIDDNLLWYKIQYKGEPERVCLVIPESHAEEALKEAHGTIFTGHEGVAKTTYRVTQHFWWPRMADSITEFIKHCEKCQKTRKDNHPAPSLVTPNPICTEPNQRVHADLFGTLKAPGRSKKYILCITDAFTKYVELVVVPDKEAETVSDAIFIHWIMRYGIPMEIITDQGKEFCNKLSDELFKLLNVTHNTTTAYHPQCNAQAEVANKTIAKYLRSFVNQTTFDWEDYIAPMMFAYNTSLHRTIQTSPHMLTFGTMARQPAFDQNKLRSKYYEQLSIQDRHQLLQEARNTAWKNSMHQQKVYQEQFDKHAKPHEFQVNQWVLLQDNYFLDRNAKLAEKYSGPYKILQLRGLSNAIIQVKNKKVCVSTNRLKMYHRNSKFETFDNNFQKQGGDCESEKSTTENFEYLDRPKFDHPYQKTDKPGPTPAPTGTSQPEKRKRGRPRKQQPELERVQEDHEDHEDEGTMERIERVRRNMFGPNPVFRVPSGIHPPVQRQHSGMLPPVHRQPSAQVSHPPLLRRESTLPFPPEVHTESEFEEDSEDELAEVNGTWVAVPNIFKVNGKVDHEAFQEYCRSEIERRVNIKRQNYFREEMEKQRQRKMDEQKEKVNYIWQRPNPIRERVRKLIKQMSPAQLAPYARFNEEQLINFFSSGGDINCRPDDPLFISVGSVPLEYWQQNPQLFPNPPIQNLQQNLPEVDPPDLSEDEEEEENFQTPPASPQPAPHPVQPPGGTRPIIDLERVRPELLLGTFDQASVLPDLNIDEQNFFRRKFYGGANAQRREVVQEQGRATRHNESGIRTFLKKK